MNTSYFYKDFWKEVRSKAGESAHLTGSAHPHSSRTSVSNVQRKSKLKRRVFLQSTCDVHQTLLLITERRQCCFDVKNVFYESNMSLVKTFIMEVTETNRIINSGHYIKDMLSIHKVTSSNLTSLLVIMLVNKDC